MENELNLTNLPALLTNICKDCDHNSSADCKQTNCLIRFARRTLNFATSRGILDVPGASKLIPKSDFKHYYPEAVAQVIAESCRQCRECQDNHSDDCIISLVRSALELAVLNEPINYPGSIFMYLAQIRVQNPEISEYVATALKNK